MYSDDTTWARFGNCGPRPDTREQILDLKETRIDCQLGSVRLRCTLRLRLDGRPCRSEGLRARRFCPTWLVRKAAPRVACCPAERDANAPLDQNSWAPISLNGATSSRCTRRRATAMRRHGTSSPPIRSFQPGPTARPHSHTLAALRFVLDAANALYTAMDGR